MAPTYSLSCCLSLRLLGLIDFVFLKVLLIFSLDESTIRWFSMFLDRRWLEIEEFSEEVSHTLSRFPFDSDIFSSMCN